MDLTSFTKPKKKEEKQLILDNDEITITKQADSIEFTLKKKEALSKYQNFLFFAPTHALQTENNEEAKQFFDQSIREGVEGLMFKSTTSPYKPGLRTGAMAKLKETKEDLDVVIIGAEYGKGKRAGFYSSFYIAVKNDSYTDQTDQFLEVGKVSSGIKELSEEGASLKKLTELLEPLKLKEEKGISYFEPKIVLQVRYQEIQKSTSYTSGYALRFPRIIFLREDKDPAEINSIEDVEAFL